ncbi:MAG: rRNA adenine N-6-methyltransferase family protein [Nitrososphaeria archaeon]
MIKMRPGDKRFLNYEWIPMLANHVPAGLHIFEIGTGDGNITESIAKISQNVRTFEIDKKLYKIAVKRLNKYQNVQVYNDDALSNVPFSNEVVFSDLPFSQSRRFIDWVAENPINDIYVVVQREFYGKIMAETGTRKYGAISVIAQFLFDIKKIIDVPASAYTPAPAVSAVYLNIKRIRKCVLSKSEIIAIRNFMSNKTSKSRIDGKRVFQLKPEEVIEQVGIHSC